MAEPVTPVLDAENVRVAVTGAIYGGPTSATKPTSASSATDGYVGYGYVSDDGVEESTDRSVDKLKAWQNAATVRTVVTEAVMSYKFTLIETTKDVLELFYGSTVDSTGKIEIDPGATGGQKNFIFDVIDGDEFIRAFFRGEVGEKEAIKNASGEVIGYGVTINVVGKVTKWYSSLATTP